VRHLDRGENSRRNGRKVLDGVALHEYLLANCVLFGLVPQIPTAALGQNLDSVKETLKPGWNVVQQQLRISLCYYIDYGVKLNVAYAQYELEKATGDRKGTWEQWLKDNAGISGPTGRKIRKVAEILEPYPGFKKLGLSFREVYDRINQIKVMLATDQAFCDH